MLCLNSLPLKKKFKKKKKLQIVLYATKGGAFKFTLCYQIYDW